MGTPQRTRGLSSLFPGHGTWEPMTPPGQPRGPERHLVITGGVWGCQARGRESTPTSSGGGGPGCRNRPQMHRMVPNRTHLAAAARSYIPASKVRFPRVLLKAGLCTPGEKGGSPAACTWGGSGRSSPAPHSLPCLGFESPFPGERVLFLPCVQDEDLGHSCSRGAMWAQHPGSPRGCLVGDQHITRFEALCTHTAT